MILFTAVLTLEIPLTLGILAFTNTIEKCFEEGRIVRWIFLWFVIPETWRLINVVARFLGELLYRITLNSFKLFVPILLFLLQFDTRHRNVATAPVKRSWWSLGSLWKKRRLSNSSHLHTSKSWECLSSHVRRHHWRKAIHMPINLRMGLQEIIVPKKVKDS